MVASGDPILGVMAGDVNMRALGCRRIRYQGHALCVCAARAGAAYGTQVWSKGVNLCECAAGLASIRVCI